MPKPVKRETRYMPGLDGLRAIAVLGVIAYHLNFGWAAGGLLGVGVFFTLSGYLITDILLTQVSRGGIKLAAFWLARARRLLPALFVMLAIVMAWVTVFGPHQPSDFRMDVVSASAYFNNWWLIFHNVSYFAQFAAPSPLNHLWSLSIEEQFYIVWPFLLLIGVHLVREVPNGGNIRPRLGLVWVGLAIASAVLMAVLYVPSLDPSRVYYGTDTRAQELLIGAALATVWPSRQLRRNIAPQARRMIDWAGVVGLLIVGLMFWRCGEYSPFLYRGGFLALSLGTALLLVALAHPASKLARVIGMRPLRWIGERSYGIYLWHFPIIVLTTPEGAQQQVDIPRAIVQVAATFIVAALSWKYIENPIRRGGLLGLRERIRASKWVRGGVSRPAWAIVALVGFVMVSALAGMAGAGVGGPRGGKDIVVASTKTVKDVKVDAKHTMCKNVTYIGDSTSLGLVSPDYLPNKKERISAQFARVGAVNQHLEVSGGRSIFETIPGIPNAYDVGSSIKAGGFKGCWVLGLGTNEAADVAAGSANSFDDRIRRMMSLIRNEPVMWVNVKTIATSGPYTEPSQKAWDKALLAACDRYPHMRIYDWAHDVKRVWFIPDGIHFTTPGYAQRSRLIADALRDSFPDAGGHIASTDSSDCLVHPDQDPPKT